MRKWRVCSGTMSDGRRHCHYKATTKRSGKWYCNKCLRKLLGHSTPKPEREKHMVINPAGRLSASDLKKLYRDLKRHQDSGGTVDAISSKVLVNETLPSLLLEVMKQRGISPPEE